jgi:hypothetical protein
MTTFFLRFETRMRVLGVLVLTAVVPESGWSQASSRPTPPSPVVAGGSGLSGETSGDGQATVPPSYIQFAQRNGNMLEIGTGRKFGGSEARRLRAECSIPGGDFGAIVLAKVVGPSGSPTYFAYVSYIGERFLSESGAPLQVLADGELTKLPLVAKPEHDVGDGGIVQERAVYGVDASQLDAIATARAIQLRIGWAGGTCSAALPAGSVAVLRQFVAREVAARGYHARDKAKGTSGPPAASTDWGTVPVRVDSSAVTQIGAVGNVSNRQQDIASQGGQAKPAPPVPASIPVVATPSGSGRRVAVVSSSQDRATSSAASLTGSRDGEVLAGSESIGAPRSNLDARDARAAYVNGRTCVGRHEWSSAERWLREAIRLDGSRAEYHAALGDVLVTQDRWPEAEAAFTAAVLLDVDNARYRERLKEARSHE